MYGLGATDEALWAADAGVIENICGNAVLTRWADGIRESGLPWRPAEMGEASWPWCALNDGEGEAAMFYMSRGCWYFGTRTMVSP